MSLGLAMITSILLLIFLIVTGPPIPFAFAGACTYLVATIGVNPSILMPSGYNNIQSYVLIALPLFILAGSLMSSSSIGDGLVKWLECFTEKLKGGLIVVSVIACALFGAVSGSGTATLTCIGTVLGPKMEQRNYPKHIYAATLCCAAPLGLLIPPSGIQIIFAWAVNVSVLGCFLAIVGPGIMLALLECVLGAVTMKKVPDLPPTIQRANAGEWFKNFGKTTLTTFPALLMPVIILGGIYGGIFTPVEAAGVSCVYALLAGLLIYRTMRWKNIKQSFFESGVTTGVMILLVLFACVFSRILTQEQMPQMIADALTSVSSNRIVVLAMVNIFLIILGMICDDTAGTLIAAPLLLPVVTRCGMSPYQFAALLGVNLGMGCITPPCAPFLYLASRLFKCPVEKMIPHVLKILLFCYLPVLIAVTYWPALSLTLVKLVMGAKFIIFPFGGG